MLVYLCPEGHEVLRVDAAPLQLIVREGLGLRCRECEEEIKTIPIGYAIAIATNKGNDDEVAFLRGLRGAVTAAPRERGGQL